MPDTVRRILKRWITPRWIVLFMLIGSAALLKVWHHFNTHANIIIASTADEKSEIASNPLTTRLHQTAVPGSSIDQLVDKLPTSGASSSAPLPGGFGWIAVDPLVESVVLTSSTDERVTEEVFFKYIKRLQLKCPKQMRMGRKEDGGWDVCIAKPFNISRPCLVYSIGMGGEWSFDEMITSQYGCQDMAYDPTLGKPDHTPRPNLWFYNTGLGGADAVNNKKWRLKTFPTILRENNHSEATIDILKMDIEYSEWESLETIVSQPDCLRKVKQLMVEYHTRELTAGQSSSAHDLLYYWNIARGIDKLGFKVWNFWDNPACEFKSKRSPGVTLCGCTNVYYVNTNYLK